MATVAGGNGVGLQDGLGTNVRFARANAITVDRQGNLIMADSTTLREISPSGQVRTIAGSMAWDYADGLGSNAAFRSLFGLAIDGNGNIFGADIDNCMVRQINPVGMVTTLAGSRGSCTTRVQVDGTGTAASFLHPYSIAIATDGSLFVSSECIIRRVTSMGSVTAWVGSYNQYSCGDYADGVGTSAVLSNGVYIALNAHGVIYVADTGNRVVRMVAPDRTVTTIGGSIGVGGNLDGVGASARFGDVRGLAVDRLGDLWLSDCANNNIRKMASSGVFTTVAGSLTGRGGTDDGWGTSALLNQPMGIAVDANGTAFIADSTNSSIRAMAASECMIGSCIVVC